MVTEFLNRDNPRARIVEMPGLRDPEPPQWETPTAEDCEAQILAIIMNDQEALDTALAQLKPEHFYVKYRPAWQAVLDLLDEAYPSYQALSDKLGQRDETELVDELIHLQSRADVFDGNISYYINRVLQAYRDRQMQAAAGRLAALVNRGDARADEYRQILDQSNVALAASTQDGLLKHASIEELEDMLAPDYVIEGVLVERSDTIVVAGSQFGKTALALDLSLPMAAGRDWHGRKTRQGDVIYVAGEGAAGLPKRVRAWRLHNGVSRDELKGHFHTILQPVNLLSPAEVGRLKQTIDAMVPPDHPIGAIVIDTLSRCTAAGGNINIEQDAGKAMLAIQDLRETYGCLSVTLAHPGYEGTRIRSSSVFPQWTDQIYQIKLEDPNADHLEPESVILVDSGKTKEDGRPDTIRLVASLETWAEEQTGRTIGALVLDSADGIPAPDPKASKGVSKAQLAIDAILECLNQTSGKIKASAIEIYCRGKGIGRTLMYEELKTLIQHGKVMQDVNGYSLSG